MGFKLITSNENSTATIQLKSSTACVKILPEVGALLQSYEVNYGNNHLNCIDGLKNLTQVKDEVKEWYRGTKLSPFPARILNGTYQFNNKSYQFENKFPDGSAIHGLLFNKSFEIVNQSILDNCATVTLLFCYRGEDKGYPFDYDCYVEYSLDKNNALTITTTIANEDIQDIPIADGWHPYFCLGGKVDDWSLKVNSVDKLALTKQLVPDGSKINAGFEDYTSLHQKSLDDCFIAQADLPTAILTNESNGWSVEVSLMENYPFLQVFTPDHRDSIAIEPFSAAPNAFNNEIGLTKLAVSEQISFVWRLHLQHSETKYR